MTTRLVRTTALLAILGAALAGSAEAATKKPTATAKKTGATAKKPAATPLPKAEPARNPGISLPDSATGNTTGPKSAPADSGYTIPAGQEGAVFRSLTVEGEDRVHFEFERPQLKVDLDPHTAPGLDPGNAAEVLMRSGPDLVAPFQALSRTAIEPAVARPWLSQFASGPVARFRPEVTDVARWRLTVANAKGETVATMEGKGQPPKEIPWDGRAKDGSMVMPELVYSYVFEAHDRAGNKRNFLGEGFRVSAYRTEDATGPRLAFAARRLAWTDESGGRALTNATPPILIESARWLNQAERATRPVVVTVSARSYDQAQTLATRIAGQLAPYMAGDPSRVQGRAVVQPDAPDGGTVAIGYER